MSVESFQPRLDSGSSAPPPEPEKSKAPIWIGVGILAVALAGGGYFFLNNNKHATAAQTPGTSKTTAASSAAGASDNTAAADASIEPQPTVDMSIIQGKVDDLLEKARLAMRERRYLENGGAFIVPVPELKVITAADLPKAV